MATPDFRAPATRAENKTVEGRAEAHQVSPLTSGTFIRLRRRPAAGWLALIVFLAGFGSGIARAVAAGPAEVTAAEAGRLLNVVSGVEAARRAAREQIGHGADLLKVYADRQYPTLSAEEIHAVVEEAHRFHMKVAAHATTPEGMDNVIAAGADSIEHATSASPENLRRMKAEGITWATTEGQYFNHANTAEVAAEKTFLNSAVANGRANIAIGQKIGLVIISGFDPVSPEEHGHNAEELVALSDRGLGPLGAMRAATPSASALMGWRGKVGSPEPGRYADIIAVAADPLADITVLRTLGFVMKGGEVVRNDVKP